MMFTCRKTPLTYGELINWDTNPEAAIWMQNGVGFQPGEGLYLLKIQQEILRFLFRCSQILLQDAPLSELVNGSIPIFPEPSPISLDDGPFPSIESIAAEAPYRVPANVNFERLLGIVAAKQTRYEDHIWALWEDPGYFFEMCIEESEHWQQVLPDVNGDRHPEFNNPF